MVNLYAHCSVSTHLNSRSSIILNSSSFLLSTHYTHYNPWLFAVNLTALVFVLLPKLPMVRYSPYQLRGTFLSHVNQRGPLFQFHRQRLRFLPAENASGVSTPVTPNFPHNGASTPPIVTPPNLD